MSTSSTLRYLTVPCPHLLYLEPIRWFSSLSKTHAVILVKLSPQRHWIVSFISPECPTLALCC